MSRISFFGPSELTLRDKDFTFKTISVTSSLTPLIDENSWRTPSIWIAVMADPWIEESKILLKELPIVRAKPFSRGSAITVAKDLSSLLFIFNLLGLINDFQFLSIIAFSSVIPFFFLVVSIRYEALE
jgi:hypothetical protein